MRDFYRAFRCWNGVLLQNATIITIDGLDFTGLQDVEVSFAARGDAAFSWDSEIHLDYSLSGGTVGTWVDWADTESNNGGIWELDDFTMPSALDGENNVSLRIRTTSTISAYDYIDFDNIRITAVPEPAHYAALTALAALGLILRRRFSRNG